MTTEGMKMTTEEIRTLMHLESRRVRPFGGDPVPTGALSEERRWKLQGVRAEIEWVQEMLRLDRTYCDECHSSWLWCELANLQWLFSKLLGVEDAADEYLEVLFTLGIEDPTEARKFVRAQE
jgi:hypothetical protein